jgi:glyoxylate/hydroxypyruvate reductase A
MSSLGQMVFYSDFDDFNVWKEALQHCLPELEIVHSTAVTHPEKVHYALVWKPPQGFFARFDNLKLVINLGAGVDSLVGRPDLPDLPITRLSDPNMARMMAGYVLFAVLRYAREIPYFEQAQQEPAWSYRHPRSPEDVHVGVLGLGELGAYAATELVRQGFTVHGWSRSQKEIEGVCCSYGTAALPAFLGQCETIVVMLPLTPETRGLLDEHHLNLLPRGANIINVSRGEVIVEDALINALKTGQIGQATLDVFTKEPLPLDSPLWAMQQVLITPHLASVALPLSSSPQIVDNVLRICGGKPVLHQIEVMRGY